MKTAVRLQYKQVETYREGQLPKFSKKNLRIRASLSKPKVPEFLISLALPCEARREEKSLFFSQSLKINFSYRNVFVLVPFQQRLVMLMN